MPRVRLRLIVAVLALVSCLLLGSRFGNAQHSGVDTYAITNARIVPVAGAPIERGTIVIRNGLIVAVGVGVSTPPDARVIDGNGLTVYPGLIDAYTNLALPESAASPATGGGFFQVAARPTPGNQNSTQVVGLQPEVMVEDVIRTGAADVEASRNIGITSALTVPRSGIWMGQSALINLAGETPQQMIVRSPVAMHIGFTPLRGSYPGSLMGVFAVLRQMMLDAQRYRDSLAIYERAPRGTRRPDIDRSLAALIPVIEGRMPVVMYADREREIERALDLAQEFKLRAIIAGGRESARLADRLARQNVPVLLSLNLPRRTTAAIPEADPEPLRVLRERVEAQQTGARLVQAKVRFAFQSGALANMSDLLPNAAKMIENGLSPDDALKAFTLWPAQILGVENQLGTIETGKIANLTVVRGDVFDRTSRIAYVFIDGRPTDLRTTQLPVPARATLTGAWTLNIDFGQGARSVTLNLQQEGDRLRGALQGTLGTGELANASSSQGGDIRFTVPLNIEGQTKEANFAGTLVNNEIRGSVNIPGMAPGTFNATRVGPTP